MAFFTLSILSASAPLFSTLSTPFKPSPVFLLPSSKSIPSVRSMRSSLVAMAPDEEKMTRRSPPRFPHRQYHSSFSLRTSVEHLCGC
ncbi:RNA-binding region-containing protein 3-like [Salvia divinorum]|uniref:RNA-binding region-containing protein 3-like n=1 Tax=Salvia divinorum TaxID=28513 RepID=A0ABD1FQ49_SALDI